jgi:hypothetical protein
MFSYSDLHKNWSTSCALYSRVKSFLSFYDHAYLSRKLRLKMLNGLGVSINYKCALKFNIFLASILQYLYHHNNLRLISPQLSKLLPTTSPSLVLPHHPQFPSPNSTTQSYPHSSPSREQNGSPYVQSADENTTLSKVASHISG